MGRFHETPGIFGLKNGLPFSGLASLRALLWLVGVRQSNYYFLQIPDSFSELVQPVTRVYDGVTFPASKKLLDDYQIRFARMRK